MLTHILSGILIVIFSLTAAAQDNSPVKWMGIEEAVEKLKKEPLKIFVDVYTDWCGWCKRMEANTFSHPVIAAYLNENYYPVKLNAEHKEPLTFQGITFKNQNPEGRRHAHDLAAALLQGQMGYPSVVFIDEESNVITTVPGFKQPQDMEPMLHFFKEDAFKEIEWEQYLGNFESQIE